MWFEILILFDSQVKRKLVITGDLFCTKQHIGANDTDGE